MTYPEGKCRGYALVTCLEHITYNRIADRIIISNDVSDEDNNYTTTDYENCYSVVIVSTTTDDAIDIVHEEFKMNRC